MATQKAISANPTKNNGGAAINAGTDFELNPVLGSRINSSRNDLGAFGSTVVENINNVAALTGGIFGQLNDIVGKRLSDTLAGTVSNTTLLSGALVPGLIRSIHKLEVLRTRRVTTAIRAGYWNEVTGTWSTNPTNAVDTLATDDAANPTRSVPGELTYKTGAPVPVQDDYKAKTS